MFVPFDQLLDTARIWIYPCARQLTVNEVTDVSNRLRLFINNWTAHGKPMYASFTISHRQFIVVAADEQVQPASGCSIDDSVRVIKELDKTFSLELVHHALVIFLHDERPVTIPVSALKSALAENKWNANSLVFDVTVATVGEFKKRFVAPAGKTWLQRYLQKQPA
jgi:hypothetical protein